jgi:hypothetical protein
MKNKILLTLVLFLFVFSKTIKAQYLGGQVGVSYIFGFKAMPTIGLHFNTMLWEQPVTFGLNYHLPFKIDGSTDAIDVTGYGNDLTLAYVDKISMFDFHAFYRYYFGDNSLEDGGMYALGGFTVGIAHETIIPGAYDASKYRLSSDFDQLTYTYVQPYLTLGLGYDYKLDNDHLLGVQFLLNLNATSFNSRTGASGDQTIPSFVGLRATYALPLSN